MEATFHKGKLYIPKSIREKLGFADGDKIDIRVQGAKEFVARIKENKSPENRFVKRVLENPFVFKLKRHMKREEYYED